MTYHLEITFWHNPSDVLCEQTSYQIIVADASGQMICKKNGVFAKSGFDEYRKLKLRYSTPTSTSKTTVHKPNSLYRFSHTY